MLLHHIQSSAAFYCRLLLQYSEVLQRFLLQIMRVSILSAVYGMTNQVPVATPLDILTVLLLHACAFVTYIGFGQGSGEAVRRLQLLRWPRLHGHGYVYTHTTCYVLL